MNIALHPRDASSRTKRIALIGNPNSGKSTVFNRLTGLRQKVANYPGVTVERHEGVMTGTDGTRLLDLPGGYSLTPRSVDQRIARDALMGWTANEDPPDGVVVVVDASNLERNLYLATQAIELNLPTIVVCNMLDAVRNRGDSLDLDKLAERIGATVIGTVASTGEGIDRLKAAITGLSGCAKRDHGGPVAHRLKSIAEPVRQLLTTHNLVGSVMVDAVAELLLSPAVLDQTAPEYADLPAPFRTALADIHRQAGLDRDATALAEAVQARYRWLSEVVDEVLIRAPASKPSLADRWDHLTTHPVWGLTIFAATMMVMFLAVFSWCVPVMDLIDAAVAATGAAVAALLGDGLFTDLLVDGVIAGAGNVVVFFPQICILFLFIAVLEDSGYMARVAFIMDRLMCKVGLHGKSFIPLLSSFACAVPAIMATRTIENRRDRLTTMLVAPLMSCSARLPIYIILITALFGDSLWLKIGIIFGMYALGTVTALLVAMVLKRTLFKGPTPTFILELPPYRMPRIGTALRNMWDRSKIFLTQAGTIILAFSVVLWALAYYPRPSQTAAPLSPGEQLQNSYMGRIGRFIEPAVEPLGFDWKIGIGLASSFAAREVFIATMGVVYGVADDADENSLPLRQRIAADTWPDGRRVFTPLVGISLMVFYVLACQCMSTLAIVRRETGTWRWPIFMFTYMTILAYLASLTVYQTGKALGFA